MTHEHTTITAKDMAEHREALCAWAEANGLDPKLISADPVIVCHQGARPLIEYQAFVLDEAGRRQLDPTAKDAVLTVRRTTRLVSPLAAHGLDADQLGRA
ncbi:hypothetical protein ABZV65_13885 [Streptomyces bauhiniae]|uniref:hypothetical protein n=1 Tax=Streptomyces bauhiniae TaxID=2340725 RepID=UPI0033ADF873